MGGFNAIMGMGGPTMGSQGGKAGAIGELTLEMKYEDW